MKKKWLILSFVFVVFALTLIWLAPGVKLPARCTDQGATETLEIKAGDDFTIGGESLHWNGVSVQPGGGNKYWFNEPVPIGGSFLAGQKNGLPTYEFEVIRCGRNRFSVWKN